MRDPTCTRCPLHQGVKTVCIAADGPISARLLVIGEGPGADEDDVGKPFVGMSGKLLRAALDRLGVTYRITNTVRCRPPDNRKPLAEEILACRPYLEADFAEMPNLKVVVTLGDIATKAMGLKGQFMKELAGVPYAPSNVVVSHTPEALGGGPGRLDAGVGQGLLSQPGSESAGLQRDGTQGSRADPGDELVRRPVGGAGRPAALRPRRAGWAAYRLVPLAHPAYVLRNRTYLSTWEAHWMVVRNLLVPTDDPAARIGAEINDRVVIP